MNQLIPGSEIYLNGKWVARDEAFVSVFDRGFIFGDGVYELIPAYNNKPFLAEPHLARFERSLASVDIVNPLSSEKWLELIHEIAAKQSFDLQRIYLQITRGVAPRLHHYPADPKPSYLMFSDELVLPTKEVAFKGFKAITHEDFRWQKGNIKTTSLLAAVLSSEMAAQANAIETIFIRDGFLTEGASSNVLVSIDGKLISPPQPNNKILSGITLSLVTELAKETQVELISREISEDELRNADEILISASAKEIASITTLDDALIGDGKSGPFFEKLWNQFRTKISV